MHAPLRRCENFDNVEDDVTGVDEHDTVFRVTDGLGDRGRDRGGCGGARGTEDLTFQV